MVSRNGTGGVTFGFIKVVPLLPAYAAPAEMHNACPSAQTTARAVPKAGTTTVAAAMTGSKSGLVGLSFKAWCAE